MNFKQAKKHSIVFSSTRDIPARDLRIITLSTGVLLSGDLMDFDFLNFGFFPVTYSFMQVLNSKENKKVATICFEMRIPMKMKMKIFYVSFQNTYLYLVSPILFWKKPKKYGNGFFLTFPACF